MTYYHGGAPGRLPGDYLLPPSETGVKPLLAHHEPKDKEWVDEVRDDSKVYVTTERNIAIALAAFWTDGETLGGSVYAVEPVGELEADPDYLGEGQVSFRCDSAKVLAILRAHVSLAAVSS